MFFEIHETFFVCHDHLYHGLEIRLKVATKLQIYRT